MSGTPQKRVRLINRTVEGLKILAEFRSDFKSDKGMVHKLDNIAKIILWNLKMSDRHIVKDAFREVKKGTSLEDWSEKFWAANDPLEPLHDDDGPVIVDPDADIYKMLADGEPLAVINVEVDRRTKEREIKARLAATRKLEKAIEEADPKTLAMIALPLMRSGGVLQDRDPPKVIGDAPPRVRIKTSDGIMELGAIDQD